MKNQPKYDSKEDTLKHIARVKDLCEDFLTVLGDQVSRHDASKLKAPEKQAFDKITPLLKQHAYGSEGYQKALKQMQKKVW